MLKILRILLNLNKSEEQDNIDKCKGTDCPLKYSCLRFLSPDRIASDEKPQYYLPQVPYNSLTYNCDFLIKVLNN